MPRLTVDISEEKDAQLTGIAIRQGISKAKAMREAVDLLLAADREGRLLQAEKNAEISR